MFDPEGTDVTITVLNINRWFMRLDNKTRTIHFKPFNEPHYGIKVLEIQLTDDNGGKSIIY